ncbi:GNAT family N-acetyltransferase [Amycolatopsis palatopharyngis]|uniref:GNAT family N-acetyltransferase n=1 Tax=Amycolatopsis palatopharyngis TaxID=187982 RepID=UPI000E275D08|nr:GNAT family N-acetyltransferase [Amycolatopsis palatopharyngis]
MTESVEVLDPGYDAEPADWSGLCRTAARHASWDFGLLGVESRYSRHPTRVAVVRRDGIVTGALVSTLIRSRGGPSLVEVHNPWLSGFPGWAFADRLEPVERRAVLRACERALCRAAGAGCTGLLYRSVPADSLSLVRGRGRIVRPATGTAILDNTFTSGADWIASLPRSRRHSIRGQVRKVEADSELVVRFETARDDLDGAELAELVNRHRHRLGRPKFDSRSPVTAEYLHALVRRKDVRTLTYHNGDGKLLAFADLLDHPDVPLYQHWAALLPEEGGRKHLYFDSYARLIGQIVADGRKSLAAGRGRLELKASLGLGTRPLWAVGVPRPVAGR